MSEKKKESEALKEIGKALLAFANILTALFLVNIMIIKQGTFVDAISLMIGYGIMYFIGYRIIKKGENNGI